MSAHVRYNPAQRVGKMVGNTMARRASGLSARTVQTVTTPGRHSDGDGLYLNVTDTGAKSWVFMWKVAGKRREMGLGPLRDVPLAEARDLAAAARKSIRAGADPIVAREQRKAVSFGEAADALVASISPMWRNDKHRAQWTMTLTVYCAELRKRPVADVNTDDVLRVLNPIWLAKPETASRLRGRIEKVLDFAKARGMRSGENPARWRGHLDAILPRPAKLTRGHHKALPFEQMPEFMARLREVEGMSARALELCILTAARSGEILGARWDEFDFESKVWTVPAARMKGGRTHRVPLSDAAMAVVSTMRALSAGEYVFPGRAAGRPLSGMALEMTLRRMKVDATVHGFRSAFRDFAGEMTTFPREVAEAALAHLVGDDVERAYRRRDALEQRRGLMATWATYCETQASHNVIALRRDA